MMTLLLILGMTESGVVTAKGPSEEAFCVDPALAQLLPLWAEKKSLRLATRISNLAGAWYFSEFWKTTENMVVVCAGMV